LLAHACLGIWLEPVVSRSYHNPRRQRVTKSWKILNDEILCVGGKLFNLI